MSTQEKAVPMGDQARVETPMTQQDVVAAVLAALGPILDRVALTPEKIEQIKRPYIDPVMVEREKRHRIEMAKDVARGLADRANAQSRCPHAHDGRTAISLVNNHPDQRIRGRCNMCDKLIQPAHYEIAAGGKAYVVPADSEYEFVMQLDASTVAGY